MQSVLPWIFPSRYAVSQYSSVCRNRQHLLSHVVCKFGDVTSAEKLQLRNGFFARNRSVFRPTTLANFAGVFLTAVAVCVTGGHSASRVYICTKIRVDGASLPSPRWLSISAKTNTRRRRRCRAWSSDRPALWLAVTPNLGGAWTTVVGRTVCPLLPCDASVDVAGLFEWSDVQCIAV